MKVNHTFSTLARHDSVLSACCFVLGQRKTDTHLIRCCVSYLIRCRNGNEARDYHQTLPEAIAFTCNDICETQSFQGYFSKILETNFLRYERSTIVESEVEVLFSFYES
jgi:hypothetical protein